MSSTRSIGRAVRACLAASLMFTAVGFAPSQAAASRLSTDRVGIVPLYSGTISYSSAPDVSARSGRLVTWQGRQLWSRGSSMKRRMASTTKVMTALIVLESCSPTETVRVTSAAARTPYAMGLKTYERRTVRQMLEYLLVASSNDAATALAIHVSGSSTAFARRMNARAKALGLTNTHYVNPHGLDATNHYTSATDLAKLMKVAMQQPEFRRIVKKRSVYLPGYRGRPPRTIPATNKLLGQVSGLRGGKTGFTDGAKYCYVANAKRNGVTLTVSVLGSLSSSARFASAKRLLEWGFTHYRIRPVTTTTQTAGDAPFAGNPSVKVPARFAEATSAAVFDLGGPVSAVLSVVPSLSAPIYAGQPLGSATLMQAGSTLCSVPIAAAVAKASAEETVATLPIADLSARTVPVRTAESTADVLPFDASRPVERVLNLPDSIAAPVSKGQVVGSATYSQDGVEIVTVPLIATEDVSAPDFSDATGLFLRQIVEQALSIPRLTRLAIFNA